MAKDFESWKKENVNLAAPVLRLKQLERRKLYFKMYRQPIAAVTRAFKAANDPNCPSAIVADFKFTENECKVEIPGEACPFAGYSGRIISGGELFATWLAWLEKELKIIIQLENDGKYHLYTGKDRHWAAPARVIARHCDEGYIPSPNK